MKEPCKEESLRWLTHAKDEFEDADELRKRGRSYLALFHFQQAAEKAFRAYLCLKPEAVQVFYTHPIVDLLEMAVELEPDFRQVAGAKKLDRYYVMTRYANGLPGGVPSRYFDDPEEAEEAMRIARSAIGLIESKIME